METLESLAKKVGEGDTQGLYMEVKALAVMVEDTKELMTNPVSLLPEDHDYDYERLNEADKEVLIARQKGQVTTYGLT